MEAEPRPLIGFRAWKIPSGDTNKIQAVVMHGIWEPGLNRASCNLQSESEAFPHTDHHCGFNAFYSLQKTYCNPTDTVRGAIVAAGRIEMHETGFRAAEAQIIGFLREGDTDLIGISEYYDVPLFDTEKELIEYAETLGTYVPKAEHWRQENPDSHDWKAWVSKPDSIDDRPSARIEETDFWYRDGEIHRDDGPASIRYEKGQPIEMRWFKEGRLHREDGLPAVIQYDSWGNFFSAEYWERGQKHRDGDLPAIVNRKESEWWIRGEWHRENGPAFVARDNELWVQHDYYHRDGGLPALIDKDYREYWVDGQISREGGLPAVESDSYSKWYENGVIHRDGDLPAVVFADGRKEWWSKGDRHRDGDRPAIVCNDSSAWWVRGNCHREGDLPAVVFADGRKEWWSKGDLHRDGDRPAIVCSDSSAWWFRGNCHREGDLPAVVSSDGKEMSYYKNGVLHRESGPAVIHEDGSEEYWIEGVEQKQETEGFVRAQIPPSVIKALFESSKQ